MLRNLIRNWDGALVLATAFVSLIGTAWLVHELGLTDEGSKIDSVILGTVIVAVVFVVATGGVALWMHYLGLRRRARAQRRRARAFLVHRETLAGR